MGETNQALWAPWRMEYLKSLSSGSQPQEGGCFLCHYAQAPDQDAANYVLWRGPRTMLVFNRFPYANGHLLVAPMGHLAMLDDLDDVTLDELIRMVRDGQKLIRAVTNCQGSNVGMNFGRCAGAGLPGHLHVHIVPRWEGDINFMPVLAETHVIPEGFDSLRDKMRAAVGPLGLPAIRE